MTLEAKRQRVAIALVLVAAAVLVLWPRAHRDRSRVQVIHVEVAAAANGEPAPIHAPEPTQDDSAWIAPIQLEIEAVAKTCGLDMKIVCTADACVAGTRIVSGWRGTSLWWNHPALALEEATGAMLRVPYEDRACSGAIRRLTAPWSHHAASNPPWIVGNICYGWTRDSPAPDSDWYDYYPTMMPLCGKALGLPVVLVSPEEIEALRAQRPRTP